MTPEGIRARAAVNRRILTAPFDLTGAQAVQRDPFGILPLAAATLGSGLDGPTPDLHDGYFMSDDGSALLLFVRPTASAFDIAFSERPMRQARTAEAEARSVAGVDSLRVRYTGSYVYALEDAATLKRDLGRYVIFALAGVLVVFHLGYRNLRILPFVTYPLVVSTLVTFAVSLLLFDQLNAVSLSFAAILYGLSIDTGIHFYTRFLEEGRRRQSLIDRVASTLSGLGRANVVGSATTAIVFFLLGLSCLSAVRQLGVLAGLGMVLTSIQFFLLYPALAFWLTPPQEQQARMLDTPRLAALAHAATRHARFVALASGLAAVGILMAASRVPLDVTLTHLRPRHSDAARVQEEVETRFGRQGSGGAVLVHRHNLDEALADSERVAARLRAYEEEGSLESVRSVEAILPSEGRQQARLKLYDALPRAAAVRTMRQALSDQGFAASHFENAFAEVEKSRNGIVRFEDNDLQPLRFVLDRYVRVRDGDATVATYVQPSSPQGWMDFAERLRGDLSDIRIQVAARPLLELQLEDVLESEIALFFSLAILSNAILIFLTFRSFGLMAAILAPVLLSTSGVFAVMYLTGTALNPVNLVIIPLILGIGVDDGVYVTARMLEVGDIAESIRHAGRALVMTSLTTIAGFGFLGISDYPPLASMGRLVTVGLLISLTLSVTLLPALLRLLSPQEGLRPAAEPLG
jgi:predicted RND superfamily exporter protein